MGERYQGNLGSRFTEKGIIWVTLFAVFSTSLTGYVDRKWLYQPTQIGWVDQLIYQRFQLDSESISGPEFNYRNERLPAFLTGVILHRFCNPLLANVLTKSLSLLLLVSALSISVYVLFGWFAALFSVFMACSYSWLLFSVGWDYVDGRAMMFMALGVVFFLYGAFQRKSIMQAVIFTISGFLIGCMIISQSFYIVNTIYLLLLVLMFQRKSIIRTICLLSIGGIISWGFFSVLLIIFFGGKPVFSTLLPSVFCFISDNARIGKEALSSVSAKDVFFETSYNLLPFSWSCATGFILLLGCLRKIKDAHYRYFTIANLTHLSYLLMYLILVLFQFIFGFATLTAFYYTNTICILLFMSIAAAFSYDNSRHLYLISVSVTCAVLLVFLLLSFANTFHIITYGKYHIHTVAYIGVLLLIIAIVHAIPSSKCILSYALIVWYFAVCFDPGNSKHFDGNIQEIERQYLVLKQIYTQSRELDYSGTCPIVVPEQTGFPWNIFCVTQWQATPACFQNKEVACSKGSSSVLVVIPGNKLKAEQCY